MEVDNTDELLFAAVKRGDSDAFELLFKSYYSALCRTSLLIVKDDDVAEELVSDVFLTIWTNRNEIEIRKSILGYLVFSVRNRSLNYLKKGKKVLVGLHAITNELNVVEDPSQLLVSKETLKEWENRIKTLPPQRQKIFRMNKLEGLRYREIAEILSLSEKTVRNQVQLAIRDLSTFSNGLES